MRERLRQSFFAWGWLLPTLFPLAQVSGRAIFTVVQVGYYGWAVFSLWGGRIDADKVLRLCYGLLLLTFFLGVPGADSPGHGLREWAKFAAQSAIFFLALGTFQRVQAGPQRLLGAFGVAGVAVLVVLYAMLPVQAQKPGFRPELTLLEDNLPFLTPFMLLWTNRRRRYGPWLAALVVGAVTGYVLYAQGRAALLGLLAALALYGVLVLGWRARTLIALGVALLALGLAVQPQLFLRGAWSEPSLVQFLDTFSSRRTFLWRQALASGPENMLTGVGMGNLVRHQAVLSLPEVGEQPADEVKHLHNFLLDTWYETGLLGLTALVLWLLCTLGRGVRAWRGESGAKRAAAGVYLAASAAILVSALLSFSYRSKPFSIYLPLFLGALAALERSQHARVSCP